MAETSVIVATFDEESKTYQAFSEIKRAAAERQIRINGLTIIHRKLDGSFETRDAAMRQMGGSVIGGLMGSLIGLLAGPIGMLIGWAGGSFVGGLRDAKEILDDQNLFHRITAGMEVGATALIGEVEEETPGVINQIVRKLDGELLRRRTEDVQADIHAEEERRAHHEDGSHASA